MEFVDRGESERKFMCVALSVCEEVYVTHWRKCFYYKICVFHMRIYLFGKIMKSGKNYLAFVFTIVLWRKYDNNLILISIFSF